MEKIDRLYKWVTPMTADEKKKMRILTAELGISYADVGRACIKLLNDAKWDANHLSWIAFDKE